MIKISIEPCTVPVPNYVSDWQIKRSKLRTEKEEASIAYPGGQTYDEYKRNEEEYWKPHLLEFKEIEGVSGKTLSEKQKDIVKHWENSGLLKELTETISDEQIKKWGFGQESPCIIPKD